MSGCHGYLHWKLQPCLDSAQVKYQILIYFFTEEMWFLVSPFQVCLKYIFVLHYAFLICAKCLDLIEVNYHYWLWLNISNALISLSYIFFYLSELLPNWILFFLYILCCQSNNFPRTRNGNIQLGKGGRDKEQRKERGEEIERKRESALQILVQLIG